MAARVRTRCYFDEKGTDPTYHDEGTLIRFLTKRGKIRPRTRSGLCSKHQRMIAREIKRARTLGLLPYRIIG
ncbi:30S ribosomal protein S18 [candidate division WWE3 bacterium RIFCSPHIGHO2_01_FULL_48_15]|uniref:Small ribosomal subunit protein bS18 n=1 Tax=candidate division WWE3 bacterium RIFCSPHIGHO2_01_FULL_48_15 TaxID=1802619 RepID=A0A1F4VAH9_UNCKA|nr:MAG: 30S ribosomal protein S18 [candidate division WWE3 bacterium RIFCSPHIGHO2_01_FULL_48_15]